MRILVVDNDARIVELVSWFLEERGFQVERAASFREARALLAVRSPDLMLSDLDLGIEDGREELWRLAHEGLLPPTLVVSGYLTPALTADLARLPGLLGTLAKPFDFEVLEARIRALPAAQGRGPEGAPGSLPDPAAVPAQAAVPSVPEPPEDDDGWMEIRPAAERGV